MSERSSLTPESDDGLRQSLETLTTEAVHPGYTLLDTLSTTDLVAALAAEDATVPAAVAAQGGRIAQAVDVVVARMRRGGRLVYCGAGTAGRMGVLDASECPPTFGVDASRVVGIIAGGPRALQEAVEGAEDDVEAGRTDLAAHEIVADDTVVGLSASGRTPYVMAALTHAREQGAATVAVACNAGSQIGAVADIAIEVVVGPELLTGSTRLKAGTAQKLVLNSITTATMVRLGKTYGNLMVDLRATNHKLRARAERTVVLATHTSAERSAAALRAADGSVKTAILSLLADLDPTAASRLLEDHDGFLRAALEAATRP